MSQVLFGFEASQSRAIDLDESMPESLRKIYRMESSLRNCISCGKCAAICTAGHFTEMQFYRMNLLARRGQLEQMKSKARACMLCGVCQMSCPRGVNIRHGILLMSEL